MKLAPDKRSHLRAGAAASVVGGACWLLSGAPLALLPWFALLASGVAGATKEVADRLDNATRPGQHEVSFWDFAATLAGGLPLAAGPWAISAALAHATPV